MGMDYTGETYGSDSSQYRNQAILQDTGLATLIQEWMQLGYNILVTGDHGINADKLHGGTTPDVREVPLFLIRPGLAGLGNTGEVLSMLQIAPTICRLLDVPIPGTMKAIPII
jgi:arylsulfatase A-like enzyme